VTEENKDIAPDWAISATLGPWHYDADKKCVIFNGYLVVSFPNPLSDHFTDQGKPVPPTDEQTSLVALIQGKESKVKLEVLLLQLEEKLKGNPSNIIESAIDVLKDAKNAEPKQPVSEPENTKASVAFDSASTSPKPSILNKNVTIGPWVYNAETNQILFNNAVVKLSKGTHKLLALIICSSPKPIPNILIEEYMYGTKTGTKVINNRIQSVFAKLKKDLGKQLPNAINFLARDLQGCRVLANSLPVTKSSLSDENSEDFLIYGPWTYDRKTSYLFYNEELCELRPSTHAAIILAIEKAPFPLTEIDCPNIAAIAKELNANYKRLHPDASTPFWHSLPLNAYVLNVPLEQLSKEHQEIMDVERVGNIAISVTHCRIYVDGQTPVKQDGVWPIIQILFEEKNSFVNHEDFREVIDEERTIKGNERIGEKVRKLKDAINKISPGSADRYIRSHTRYGYIICDSDEDYQRAIMEARHRIANRSDKKPFPLKYG
jgi:DNA-binding response OmpR family regulator